jgi:hypothetical protein
LDPFLEDREDFFELLDDFFFDEREDVDLPFFREAASISVMGISRVNASIQEQHIIKYERI